MASENKWLKTWGEAVLGPNFANCKPVFYDIKDGYVEVIYFPRLTLIREYCVGKQGWDLPVCSYQIKN